MSDSGTVALLVSVAAGLAALLVHVVWSDAEHAGERVERNDDLGWRR